MALLAVALPVPPVGASVALPVPRAILESPPGLVVFTSVLRI
jgi:hypothetical protein